jgi:hypothetical protein
MTDEEMWRAIRNLDPDQRRNASDVACVIAIVVACVVWYWLIFAASDGQDRSRFTDVASRPQQFKIAT